MCMFVSVCRLLFDRGGAYVTYCTRSTSEEAAYVTYLLCMIWREQFPLKEGLRCKDTNRYGWDYAGGLMHCWEHRDKSTNNLYIEGSHGGCIRMLMDAWRMHMFLSFRSGPWAGRANLNLKYIAIWGERPLDFWALDLGLGRGGPI